MKPPLFTRSGKPIVMGLLLVVFLYPLPSFAKREVYVSFSPISHQWCSMQSSPLWANDINFDCTFWNPSSQQQRVTVIAHWTGSAIPLLNGTAPLIAPGPTSSNVTLEAKQTYIWNSSYCTGKFFAKIYCANSTHLSGLGVPKGLSIQVHEDQGFITGNCTIYNQSAAGMTSFSAPVNGGKPF